MVIRTKSKLPQKKPSNRQLIRQMRKMEKYLEEVHGILLAVARREVASVCSEAGEPVPTQSTALVIGRHEMRPKVQGEHVRISVGDKELTVKYVSQGSPE